MIDPSSSAASVCLARHGILPTTRHVLLALLASSSQFSSGGGKRRFRKADDVSQRLGGSDGPVVVPPRFTTHLILPPLAGLSGEEWELTGGGGPVPATAAAPTSPASTTTAYSRPLPVVYTNDPDSARHWADRHLFRKGDADGIGGVNGGDDQDGVVVVGFDMESSPDLPWRRGTSPSSSRSSGRGGGPDNYFGPATIQLAVVDSALVLQIAQEGYGPDPSAFVPLLYDVLSDPSLVMVGVGLDQDLIELYRWHEEHSFFAATDDDDDGAAMVELRRRVVGGRPPRMDLGGIGATDGDGRGTTVGLKRLAGAVLNVDLPKIKAISRSRWASSPLSRGQVEYAAWDAWASAAVVHRLDVLDAAARFAPAELRRLFLLHGGGGAGNTKADVGIDVDDGVDDSSTDKNSFPIATLSERGRQRRVVRQRYKALKEQEEPWSPEDHVFAASLEKELRRLAPPAPLPFEIGTSLGIVP